MSKIAHLTQSGSAPNRKDTDGFASLNPSYISQFPSFSSSCPPLHPLRLCGELLSFGFINPSAFWISLQNSEQSQRTSSILPDRSAQASSSRPPLSLSQIPLAKVIVSTNSTGIPIVWATFYAYWLILKICAPVSVSLNSAAGNNIVTKPVKQQCNRFKDKRFVLYDKDGGLRSCGFGLWTHFSPFLVNLATVRNFFWS